MRWIRGLLSKLTARIRREPVEPNSVIFLRIAEDLADDGDYTDAVKWARAAIRASAELGDDPRRIEIESTARCCARYYLRLEAAEKGLPCATTGR